MANFCPQCGGKIEAGQMKCSFCGKDLSNLQAGNSTMQYGSQNDSQNTAYSQSNNQNSAGSFYESQNTNPQYGNQGSTGNQYVSQNTVNQYSTQGTDNQYGQSTANQYTSQNAGNTYSNYQDNTSAYTAYQPVMPPTVPQSQGPNGLQIAGLVLGIISIVACCCYGVGGLIFGVAGLVCSIMGNKENKHGVGTGGLVCSVIGIVVGVLGVLFYLVMILLGESLDYFMY